MKYLSLIPALWIFLLSTSGVLAANIKVEFLEKTDYYIFKVILSGLEKTTCKDKTCYLQGMFTSTTGLPKYFGYTFGQSDWFAYQSSPEKDYIKSNFVPFETTAEGTWEGLIRMQPDKEDSDYKGPGDYLIKVKRYTGEGSSPADDDIQSATIALTETTPTPTTTTTQTPTSTPTPSSIPTPTNTITPSSTPTLRNTPTPTTISTQTPTPTSTPKLSPTNTTTPTTSSPISPKTDTASRSSDPYDLLLDDASKSSDNTNISTQSSVLGSSVSKDSNTTRYKIFTLIGLLTLGVSGPLLYLRFRRVKIY